MAADFGGLLAKSKSMSPTKTPALEGTPELEEVEGEEEDPMIVRLKPIAQDLIEAIRGGDATAVAEAWMAYGDAMKAGPSEAESEYE